MRCASGIEKSTIAWPAGVTLICDTARSPSPSRTPVSNWSRDTGMYITRTRFTRSPSRWFSCVSNSCIASKVSPKRLPRSMRKLVWEGVTSTRMNRRLIIPSRSPVHGTRNPTGDALSAALKAASGMLAVSTASAESSARSVSMANAESRAAVVSRATTWAPALSDGALQPSTTRARNNTDSRLMLHSSRPPGERLVNNGNLLTKHRTGGKRPDVVSDHNSSQARV